MADYLDAIREAAGLLDRDEWDQNSEYFRGMCELISRMYQMPYFATEDGAEMARQNIALVLGVDLTTA